MRARLAADRGGVKPPRRGAPRLCPPRKRLAPPLSRGEWGALRALLDRIPLIGTARFSGTSPRSSGLPAEAWECLARTHDRIERERAGLRRFASDAAHQLRTPLAVLAARMEAPAENWDTERMRGDLRWMERLVDQLLAASRSGTTTIAADARFDVETLVRDVAEGLVPLAIYRGRDLELIDERNGPDAVMAFGNAALAHEALSNLVENALHHAPPETTVSVVLCPSGRVDVRDRGAGVPTNERERIFERFAQGHRPTTGGAGLGLSIVTDIMRLHRGRALYEDREGGGAVFALEFEVPDVPPSASRQAPMSWSARSEDPVTV